MSLLFIGMDPSTGGGGSPTVWVDDSEQEIVIQGYEVGPELLARIGGTEWVAGHATGVPEGEAVVRMPARMAGVLAGACGAIAGRAAPGLDEHEGVPDFEELLRSARHSAVHLEMRDSYGVGDEAAEFEEFRRTGNAIVDPEHSWWPQWLGLVRETVGRGVAMRRARIVSEPVTDYIRWEHAVTQLNVAAGEQVRWLPRRRAVDLALPGSDLWLIDSERVLFHYWTGDGDWAGHAYTTDPAVVGMVSAAFEAVWQRGIPHEQYTV